MADYIIEYCPPFELFRIMQAVIIDNRATLFTTPYNGNTIQDYVNAQVGLVNENVVLYKILTLNGNLVGYFSLEFIASYSVSKLQQLIRPQYSYDIANINALITTFVQSNEWTNDFLF
jgi:hypothetical protein